VIALTPIETEAGTILVDLPDRPSVREWVRGDTLIEGEHPDAGDPTGLNARAERLVCRCGQANGEQLWVRMGSRRKVLCADCRSAVPPVVEGDAVAFRLSRSDLAPHVRSSPPLNQVRLRGVVEAVCSTRELLVRVDDWPIVHCVDADALDERPAKRADMDDFWPDADPAILDQAYEAISQSGHSFVVTCYPGDD
jgi:hypothetical protein